MAGGKAIPMYDPGQGKVVKIAPQDVSAAQDEGYTLETASTAAQREYQSRAGLGEAAKALGEGVASGATLGLSDVALSELGGDEYRKSRELRRGEFGGIEMAGNVVGSLAPLLLSGGESAVAKGMSLTPTALVGRAAGATGDVVGALLGEGSTVLGSTVRGAAKWGASGLVEGAAVGAGSALSEAALSDQLGGFDAAAEHAWAGAKSGAMLGLIGGAALGGLAGATEGAGAAFAKRFSQGGDDLAELANERAVKALDPRGTEVRKLRTDAKIQQVGEDIRTYQLRDGTPVLTYLDNAESIAPKIAAARAEVGDELGAIRQKVAEVGGPVDALGYLQRVDNEVIQPLLSSPSPTIRRYGKRVMGELESLATRVGRGEEVGYGELLEQQKALKTIAYPTKAPGQGLPSAPPTWAEYVGKSERILEDEMGQHVEKTLASIDPDSVSRYADAKRLYESFTKADQILQKSTKANLGNRAVSLTDYLTGLTTGGAAIISGHPLGALIGVAATGVHKFARERGSALLATLYTRAEGTTQRLDRGIAQFFVEAEDKSRKSVHELVEKAKSVPNFSAVDYSSGEAGAETARARKRELGAEGIAKRTAPAVGGEVIEFDVRRTLRAQQHETDAQAYDRIVSKAQAIASGSGVGPFTIDQVAPRVGNSMRVVQQRAAQHLLAHAPVPPKQSTNPNLGALVGDSHPDPVALYEFSRRVRAIDRPESLVDDLKRGTISMAAVEAVRDTYPTLYASIQARVLEGLGASKALLPYEERVKLGIMFSLPTDPTLRPEILAATQAVYAQTQKPISGPQPTAGMRSASKRGQQSASERLELGEEQP